MCSLYILIIIDINFEYILLTRNKSPKCNLFKIKNAFKSKKKQPQQNWKFVYEFYRHIITINMFALISQAHYMLKSRQNNKLFIF